jgi:hypothetical protein
VPPLHRVRPPAVGAVLLLCAVAAGACSRGESRPVHAAEPEPGRATDRSLARGDRVATAGDVAPPDVRPTRPAYRVEPVAQPGGVAGTVLLDGPAPPDSTVTPPEADRRACGASLAERALDVDAGAAGPGVRGAVVWLEGVAAGRPLPWARRYELALDGCRLTPRHLAVAAGGTLNVHGIDALASRLRFVRAAGPPAPARPTPGGCSCAPA